MTTMIRKQVYLEARQDSQIKELAGERSVTEAEIIREAIDLFMAEIKHRRRAQAAWEEAQALMMARAAQGMETGQQFNTVREAATWTRDELYSERLERYG